VSKPDVVPPVGSVRWHPPRAVADLVELVLSGALAGLPAALDLLDVPDLAGLADRADPGHPGAGPAALPLDLEDDEGTPVARITAELAVEPLRPFTAPPLRAHRRGPAEVSGVPGTLVVPVVATPSEAGIVALLDEARRAGHPLLLLAVVGQGRGPLPAEALWRAVRATAERARTAGVAADVVPVAVPRLAPADADPLVTAVADAYAAAVGGTARALPSADAGQPEAEAFAAERERTIQPPARRGVTVFFTGLSGSGKSTVAKALADRLVEDGRRTVTLLDGDEVRRLLSHGLGFSRADRDLNIRRIGFVAAEVTRHGGLAVCAPIAPFADVRAWVRAAVEAVGDLVLVHVATPLEECERRDRKGLYAKARRGEIPDFTGISSPYEVPTDADLVLDTTGRSVADCVDDVWTLLTAGGYLPPA
jgi:sulfate adenylyltransferase